MLRKTLLLGLLLAPALASAADLNIPAQPLAKTLREIAKLNKVEITVPADLVKDLGAPALEGDYSVEGALDTLLAGSNLTYHILDARTIEISQIDEIQITGRYEKLSAIKKEAD